LPQQHDADSATQRVGERAAAKTKERFEHRLLRCAPAIALKEASGNRERILLHRAIVARRRCRNLAAWLQSFFTSAT